jgi:predicted ATPase/DNA-binding CsgD family transcriptional regulator
VIRQTAGTARPGGRVHLPLQLTPFVNRRREVRALRPLLQQQRLVSLVGPAGTGKTRLALELATDVARRFSGGVWFAELAPISEPTLLAQAVAWSVGIADEGGASITEKLLERLRAERVLLVLDNCEHLVDEAARLGDLLLRGCPGLSLLATSRERLGIPGELVWRLDPMETPGPGLSYPARALAQLDSAVLFVDRAWRSQPEFAITDENAATVAELLRRLEGLPLAIELAAAWSGTLSPADMVARLDDRFRLLTARHRVMNPRHASLRAAIDSSYEALQSVEQSLFRQLGLFTGGWSLDSLTAVCELDPATVLDIHTRLVDRSLVRVRPPATGTTRYRMLDALREYALEKLREAGELEQVRDRFAAYLLTLAEASVNALSGADGPRQLELMDAEHDNFRALLEMVPPPAPDQALRLTVALADYWRLRGHYTEARLRVRAATRRSRERSPHLVRALLGLGMMAFLQVDRADGLRATRRALAIARRIGDGPGMLLAFEQLSRILFNSGDPAAARACLERGLRAAGQDADAVILSSYRFLLGQIALAEGRHEESASLLAEAVELGRQAGHGELSMLASSTLGRLHLLQGRPDQARPLLMETLAAARGFGPRHVVMLLDSLAALAAEEGNYERAARLAGAAATVHERAGSRPPANSPIWSQLAARWERATATSAGRRAFAEGRAMDLDQAVRFALQEEAGRPETRARPAAQAAVRLTRRQMEIARLVAEGLTNREIAARLFISERTAEGHVEQIRNKLGFSSRVQIGAWVVENDRRGA